LLKRIVNFSQSINQSPNISPNGQHLFANAAKSTTAKFAPTTQVRTNRSDSSCEHNREISVLSNCYHCSRQQLGLKSQPPIKSVSYTMTWPSMKNAMDASYALSCSPVLLISHVHSDL